MSWNSPIVRNVPLDKVEDKSQIVYVTSIRTVERTEYVQLPPDPNPRCSCKCGCNRKMLPEDKLKRVCDPCALGVHLEEEKTEEPTREPASEPPKKKRFWQRKEGAD